MWRLFRRIFVALGLWSEKLGETETLDEAQIEAGIRDQRRRADAANTANGNLKTTIILLKEQMRDENNQIKSLTALLKQAAEKNDETNGASLAEQLDTAKTELARNQEQLTGLEDVYKQNITIIGNS